MPSTVMPQRDEKTFQGWPKVTSPSLTLSSGVNPRGVLSLHFFSLSNREAALQGTGED